MLGGCVGVDYHCVTIFTHKLYFLPFSTSLLPRHVSTRAARSSRTFASPSPESFDGMTEEEVMGLRAELAATRELVLKLEKHNWDLKWDPKR